MRTRTLLAFVLSCSVWIIESTEPSDRRDTSVLKTNATLATPEVNNATLTDNADKVVKTVPSEAAPTTERAPMVMEGSVLPPKKAEPKKEQVDVKKKPTELEEKSDDAYSAKVKPRKGVNLTELLPATNCSNSMESSEKCPPSGATALSTSSTTSTTTSTTMSTTTTTTTESPETSTVHPKHHKPNVTDDVPDQQLPPKREDYVIPVVGIIFVIPLIVILGALVYKKGVDLWERRHYRPMDFLIDGIYNNQ